MRIHVTLLLMGLTLPAAASSVPRVGQPLPALEIHDKGELYLVDGRVALRPWSTENLRGHWTMLQYLAARPEASRLNRPAIDKMGAAAEAGGYRPYQLINIVNVDDVTLGATGFAMGALESNKRQYPDAPMIADMGSGLSLWGLSSRSSTIMLLDPDLIVRFVKDGELAASDIERVMDILRVPQLASGE
jgi:uncharacterized protein